MLRLATDTDAAAIRALRESLALWQLSRGIVQWKPGEISQSQIAEQACLGEWHVLDDTDSVIAAVRIVHDDSGIWTDSDRVDAGYIHGLMVARVRAGEGLGEVVLSTAENIVHNHGHRIVRLDCVASNTALRQYYQARGYGFVAERSFPTKGWHPAALFQKRLDTAD